MTKISLRRSTNLVFYAVLETFLLYSITFDTAARGRNTSIQKSLEIRHIFHFQNLRCTVFTLVIAAHEFRVIVPGDGLHLVSFLQAREVYLTSQGHIVVHIELGWVWN